MVLEQKDIVNCLLEQNENNPMNLILKTLFSKGRTLRKSVSSSRFNRNYYFPPLIKLERSLTDLPNIDKYQRDYWEADRVYLRPEHRYFSQ